MTYKIQCDHAPECSRPNTYACYAYYVELYNDKAALVEIIPDDSVPAELVCTECNCKAYLLSDAIKQERAARVKDQNLQGTLL